MKLIANHTLALNEVHSAPNLSIRGDKGRFTRHSIAPGEEFDTKKFGLSDDDAKALIADGAVRKPVKEVDEDETSAPVAENTAPRGPASGQTEPPDPNKAAADAKPTRR